VLYFVMRSEWATLIGEAVHRRNWTLTISLFLNALLIMSIGWGAIYIRYDRMRRELEAPHWARYAGTLQALSDNQHGICREYRLTPHDKCADKKSFSGDHDGKLEVWTWPDYPELGVAEHQASVEFVDAYNRCMRHFPAPADTQPTTNSAGGKR
jgi:hypothetical protein